MMGAAHGVIRMSCLKSVIPKRDKKAANLKIEGECACLEHYPKIFRAF